MVAGGGEVGDELAAGCGGGEGLGTDGPDGGDPGESGVAVPELGEVVPGAGTDSGFDLDAAFESK